MNDESPRRNIGVRSGMRTRSTTDGGSSLEVLLERMQESISNQIKEQQRTLEERQEQERIRLAEKEAEEKIVLARKEALLEQRLGKMEAQYQVLSSTITTFYEKLNNLTDCTGNREIRSVPSERLAVPCATSSASVRASQTVPPGNFTELGYVVRPSIFDGNTNWEEYKIQFEVIARANGWNETKKALALVSSLEGSSRSVLTSLSVEKQNDWNALILALDFRYGTKNLANLNYVMFQNYKQKKGQSISELATEIERLAQVAFCECPMEIKDKLSASQFISALADEEMKRMLRLEGHTGLRTVVIRALEIEAVKNMSEDDKKKETITNERRWSTRKFIRQREEQKMEKYPLECWNCKKTGHIQRNCPKLRRKEQGNSKNSV